MTETHTDFLLYSGSTWAFDAALHDAQCNPLDLTGASVVWTLYTATGSRKIELTRGNGIEMVNETGGLCPHHGAGGQDRAARTRLLPRRNRGDHAERLRLDAGGRHHPGEQAGRRCRLRAGEVTDPCATLARLQDARLALLTGQHQTRVKIEGFEVQYTPASMDALNAAIGQYETLCNRQTGKRPRRFAIGSTVRPRSY